jgi:cytochrome c oxidase subunit 3
LDKKKMISKDNRLFMDSFEKIHPYKMILFLGALGSFLIFTFLLIAFSVLHIHGDGQEFTLPKSFLLSTLFILSVSFFTFRADQSLRSENTKDLMKYLALTLISIALFLIMQSYSWIQMYNKGLFFDGHPSSSFMYVLSGLHMVHILIGFGFLIHSFTGIGSKTKDQIQELVFYSNPIEKTRLEILFLFWHYMTVIWLIVYLYLYFSF